MRELKNWLLVAGNGRNVGKTSLVCSIINKVSKTQKIIAIKVSPHMHSVDSSENIISRNKQFIITEETSEKRSKDSSRMLKSGATQVFYIQSKDEYLSKALELLLSKIPENCGLICESGGMRTIVKPGLFLVCFNHTSTKIKDRLTNLLPLADLRVVFDGDGFNINPDKIVLKNMCWHITD